MGEVAAIRASVSYERGDMQRCIDLARQALDLLPEDNLMVRGAVALDLGLAHFCSGKVSASKRAYADAITISQAAGNVTVTLLAMGCLAQLEVKRGHLQRAAELYRQARHLGTLKGGTILGPTGLACVEMGEVLREWNDLEAARRILLEGIELCKRQRGMPEYVLEGTINLARVLQANGDARGAFDAMQQAEELLAELLLRGGNVYPIISQALAYRVQLWLAQGNVAAAARWVEEIGLDVDDELCYLREGDHILLARVLIAQGRVDDALRLLERLLEAAEAGGRTGPAIEILVLKALALQAPLLYMGDSAQAIGALERALPLAELEGCVRLFVDEGEPMQRLLRQVVSRDRTPGYVSRLLAAFHIEHETEYETERGSKAPLTEPPSLSPQPLLEPLKEREISILRLIAAGLSNREIADELYLSVNTIKAYTSQIYGKMGVKKRAEAVARAHELGIL